MTAASHPRQKMRHVAKVLNSNVDKKSHPHEFPVRLCNYTDVYRHSRIYAGMDFMRATATETEMGRFLLRSGDVVITKDSEDWSDIGVPVLVVSESPDLLCGYHLTILRPFRNVILGGFLATTLQTPEIAAQLHASATGVTRYGLSLNAIRSIAVPTPPIDEQRLIVRYLDHAELRIAQAKAAKSALLVRLNEAKSAVVSELVLGDSDTRTSTGVPGLESIPSHWRWLRAKHVWRPVDVRSVRGSEERLSVSSARGVVLRSSANVTMFQAASYVGHKVVQPGNLVINSLWAWGRGLGVSRHFGLVSPVYGVYELVDKESDVSYLDHLLRSNAYQWQFQVRSKGIWKSRLSLSDNAFLDMPILLPPLEEQRSISARISERTAAIETAITAVEREIALLKEYRIRLISDVVTGKMDVTKEAASLPDIDPEELAHVLSGTSSGIMDDEDEDGGDDEDE